MLRTLHSLSALLAALFILTLAVTGALLSVEPALERAAIEVPAAGQITVAELTGRIGRHYDQVEQIDRRSSGAIVVYYQGQEQAGADLVSPFTGEVIAPYRPSAFFRWVRELHRSLLLDTPGRAVAGITALAMLILSLSGVLMLARQQGGWRRLLAPAVGSGQRSHHARLGRAALPGLLISAATGLYMSALTFGLLPEGTAANPEWPVITAQGQLTDAAGLSALQAIDVTELKELVYPYPGDPAEPYSLQTTEGAGYVDPYSGELLSWQANDCRLGINALVASLHTGEQWWWLGLALGLGALVVPVLTVTGIAMWWQRRRAMPGLAGNRKADAADTVILVGSESNSTWGFAGTLHRALTDAGHRVHTAPMNRLAHYPRARRLLILTATYGDGDAPASADRFLDRLATLPTVPDLGFAVLGFGDSQFPQFCRFARDVNAALLAAGWSPLLALDTIDRQSTQAFSRWGQRLGKALGCPLTLNHIPRRRSTLRLQLAERVNYGSETDAPVSVLRFVLPRSGWHRLFGREAWPSFEAGDLVGIYPPDSPVPRLYSLASASSDGQLEICVRRHEGGLCSGFLHGLQPGDAIEAFIQTHPAFRPNAGRAPVVLIGTGTGIGPLASFIRHNTQKRAMHLYWGGRDPDSGFLYRPELERYLADRRLTGLNTAFSRVGDRCHVQDKIRADSEQLRTLVSAGAQFLVCGGRDMANSVMDTLDQVMAPLGLNVQTLKTQGRYREDVY
ncbi:PepSY domain-containing protein [Oceanimonas sp. CHS3-5]|uniref:PepSY domain-containing protein n=1 Tax=Oceanimonas sp. CHS3-5 TaxID=3068186 RepID=UPI00273DF946|nr:PepSY domain-containing protein [Oceanimonas sp. CHS3-5]MDP5293275.1 PepSY domain-containing protein [Oceanimonas sp. CHS3-5]